MDVKTAKISVLKQSDQAVDRMPLRVNESFTGGRVTKVDLVSWILLHFETHALDNSIEKIRKDHFDQVAYLESVIKEIKQARKTDSKTPDLSSLLYPITSSLKTTQKKKGREESLENL